MRFGIAQINSTVGDIDGNTKAIIKTAQQAEQNSCDVVLFPELAIAGYPPEDLLFKKSFVQNNLKSLKKIAQEIKTISLAVGFIDQKKGRSYNAIAWIEKGRVHKIYHKNQLPNYGVFDEQRYFESGNQAITVSKDNFSLGLTICEDIWTTPIKLKRADLIINISASPFYAGKLKDRKKIATQISKKMKSPLIYCNLVGGQDELVFDGGSFVVTPNGKTVVQCPQFVDGLFVFDCIKNGKKITFSSTIPRQEKQSSLEEIRSALLLGIRDYVDKNNFKKVAIAVSGGIDSAVVAALATDALGPNRVSCVTMPSRFNKSETINDAKELAYNLKTDLITIPIQSLFQNYMEILAPTFKDLEPNIAEENLQARTRGNLIMALSNKFGWLILTTGNKSEVSTGYCTLYGDTAGGFAVLKDVLKTEVYQLAHLYNHVIPESTIKRPPTAELRDNQKDEDSLGSYNDLDRIVVGYVEENKSIQEIQRKTKLSLEYIKRIVALIDRNEYKRRQAPPGIKISPRSYGRDHRMPITNRFKHS